MTPTYQKNRHAFTMVELLTVVAVVAILAGLLLAGLQVAKRKAREANCGNNLRQIGLAIIAYRSESRDLMPPWLSALYPLYLKTPEIYLCQEDRGQPKGSQGSKPDGAPWAGDQFAETDDNLNNATATDRNPAIQFNSYMYEFSSAKCSWGWQSYLASNPTVEALDKNGDGVISWAEAKYWQLDHGDNSYINQGRSYSQATFPVIRCFWHSGSQQNSRVINLSYDGRVFISGMQWEESSK